MHYWIFNEEQLEEALKNFVNEKNDFELSNSSGEAMDKRIKSLLAIEQESIRESIHGFLYSKTLKNSGILKGCSDEKK